MENRLYGSMTISNLERRGLHEVIALSVASVTSCALAIAQTVMTGHTSEVVNSLFGAIVTALMARTLKNARDREGAARADQPKPKEGGDER
jgi:hypothetical protein